MANTTKSKKPAGAPAKRTMAKWQKQMLDPNEIKPTNVALRFYDDGSICVVTPEQDQQIAAALKAMTDQDREAYFREASRVRGLNPKLLKKTATDAITMLGAWAIKTGWCEYGERLTPRDQHDMLDVFSADAFEGIKQTRFWKEEYELHNRAYEFAKPYLVRYRKARGISNNQHLTVKQGREAWAPITTKKKWKSLVEQHAQASMFKRRKGENITQRRKRSADTIRVCVRDRWKKEFP